MIKRQIGAVTISTPDHIHCPAAMMAIKMGKHVFCQKPLTHTVCQARRLTEAARESYFAARAKTLLMWLLKNSHRPFIIFFQSCPACGPPSSVGVG